MHPSSSLRAYCPRWPLASGQNTCLGMRNKVWVCSGTTSRPARWRKTPTPSSPPSSWWRLMLSSMPSWLGIWTMSSQVWPLTNCMIYLTVFYPLITTTSSHISSSQDSTASVGRSTSHSSLHTGKVLHAHMQIWRIRVSLTESKISLEFCSFMQK